MQVWETKLLTAVIDIITIIIIIIIIQSGYKNIINNHDLYTYMIEPTNFIRQLAIYGITCCLIALLFDYIGNILYILDYFEIINRDIIKIDSSTLTNISCIFGCVISMVKNKHGNFDVQYFILF